MKNYQTISIITPNYNYGYFIDQTIESIVCQSYHNWEHIIVDDGSTDNSIDVIEQYLIKYPTQIKLIKQQKNPKKITGDYHSIRYILKPLPRIILLYGVNFN